MTSLIKKIGAIRCLYIGIILILILLIIEEKNLIDIAYLLFFVIYGIRLHFAKNHQD